MLKNLSIKNKMKNLISKTGKILLIAIILTTSVLSGYKGVKAIEEEYITLKIKKTYGNMLKYNGKEITTKYVIHNNGTEYPAYCTSETGQVDEDANYAVKEHTLLGDVELWKVVINGYPYKTYSQLGCNNKEEAYTATQEAIMCKLYTRTPNEYEAIGSAGTRVVNAMTKILNDTKYSHKYSSELEISSQEGKFVLDKIDKKYMSQTFYINIGYSIKDIKLSLEGDYPEGTKIVNMMNNEIKEYTGFAQFKIIFPIKNAKEAGSFKIKGVATTYSYPVLYGMAYKMAPVTYSATQDFEKQNYILTGDVLGDSVTYKTLDYGKNETQITIIKRVSGLDKPLEGVKFQLMDSDKNTIYTDLVTDSEGKIVIENILPGRYYLEETYTQEGYVRYDEIIPVSVGINEKVTINVNNSKEENLQYSQNNSNITVGKEESNTDISKKEENVNVQEKDKNININNKNENTNKQETNSNINIDNKNQNINEQEVNTNVNINNENINTNKQDTNTNTNISNKNENLNIQDTNNNTNIQNVNTNSQKNNIVKLPKTGM